MRIATITAKTKDGQWVTLAQPDVPLNEQKDYFKRLKAEGGIIELNGKPVELSEAHLMISGNGKKAKFHGAGVSYVGNPPEEDSAAAGPKNLAELQAALGIEDKADFDALRKANGFPGEKLEDGSYDLEAIKSFALSAGGEE